MASAAARADGAGREPVMPAPARFDERSRTVEIAGKRVRVGGPLPPLRRGEKLVSYTSSLCPACYRLLPAVIFERSGAIWIRKVCPEHGEVEELYYGDARMYYRFMRYEEEGLGARPYVSMAAPCPFNCGLCPRHKNHTALANLVVTNRCDLSCWYCFFYAERAGYVYEPTLEQIRFMIRQLKKQGKVMAVQLTGGEPTLRDDLVEIVKLLKEEGVRHVQLNTHGIKFAQLWFERGPEYAVEYARKLREAGVNTVYLSFDGVTPRANPKNHWEVPYTLEVFRRAGMTSVVLVPTVIRTINDDQIGLIVKFAAKHMDVVRGVNFQPVSLTGMMKKEERRKLRVTIADVARWLEEQTDGQIPRSAWFPVPIAAKFAYLVESITGEEQFCMANHPACGAATYVFVERGPDGLPRRFVPITEFFDVEGFVEFMEKTMEEFSKEGLASASKLKKMVKLSRVLMHLPKFVDREKIPSNLNITRLLVKIFVKRNYEALGELHYTMLFLGAMHFMDLYNYDVERVLRCNIHYLVPDGRVIPFCAFNVLNDVYRDYIQEKFKVPLDEYARRYGADKIGEAVKYVRNIKLLKSTPVYYEAYRGIVPESVLRGDEA